ncbi:MAG: hypothetical protein D6819_07465 [Gammaproteobacteria bacterium]|nr:MAG: hypothetical protein D6819_07465 [Gammaproteobacteria bacterium]
MRPEAGIWLAGLLLGGCTARVHQFHNFAEAGQAYADAMARLTIEAGEAAIDADSLALERARDALTPKERGQILLEHNRLLKERLALLADLRRHTLLLRAYFEALAALAGSGAPAGIGAASEDIIQALGETGARIQRAKVGEQPVGAFIGKAAALSVGHFRNAALEQELRARAPVLERELELQEAALEAITAQMRTDLQAALNMRATLEVFRPYRADAPLPEDWAERRKAFLTASASLASAEAARGAAGRLRQSFVALVENRFGPSDTQALLADIDAMLTWIEAIRGDKETPP